MKNYCSYCDLPEQPLLTEAEIRLLLDALEFYGGYEVPLKRKLDAELRRLGGEDDLERDQR